MCTHITLHDVVHVLPRYCMLVMQASYYNNLHAHYLVYVSFAPLKQHVHIIIILISLFSSFFTNYVQCVCMVVDFSSLQ